MGKKKKKKRAPDESPPPDPRRVALARHIDLVIAKREEEEESHRNTLQPLKRVNSNPMVYEFVPMARNMFADSKSVDFGFDGSVDVPNQSVYLEEVPDDEDFSTNPPEEFPSTMSLGYMYSTEIEDDEFEKLDNMETNDSWRFLKARIGKEKFDKLVESPQYQTILTLPEMVDELSSNASNESDVQDNNDNGWFGFSTNIFGGWWGNAEEETTDEIMTPIQDQIALNQNRTRTESVVDPPDNRNTVCVEDESTTVRRHSRTAKEKWLLYRGRMWHKSHSSKEYEMPQEVPNSNSVLDDALSDSVDEDIHLVSSNRGQSLLRDENKKHCGGKKCLLLLLILLAIIVTSLGGVFVAAYLGVRIPLLSDIVFPQVGNSSTATSSSTKYDIRKMTTTPTTISETTVYETVIESLAEIEVIPGMSPSEYSQNYPYEVGILTGDLVELNGEPFDVASYVNVDPPTEEFSNAVGIAVYDAFKYLGFEVGRLQVNTGKFGNTVLRVFLFAFGRPEMNVGVMKWYGYRKGDSKSSSTPYTTRLTKLIPKLMKERKGTAMNRFYYTVSSNFMESAEKVIDAIDIQRPPYRVPDEWGNCDGISVCELGEL